MKTTSTIPIGTDKTTLFVDILSDPPALAIRRAGGGLVRVEPGELRQLVAALIRAAGELAQAEVER